MKMVANGRKKSLLKFFLSYYTLCRNGVYTDFATKLPSVLACFKAKRGRREIHPKPFGKMLDREKSPKNMANPAPERRGRISALSVFVVLERRRVCRREKVNGAVASALLLLLLPPSLPCRYGERMRKIPPFN